MTVRRLRVDGFAALEGIPPADRPAPPDRRPVVFVHGFTGGKDDASLLLERFAAAGHPALAFDQRGTYETPGPDDEAAYSLDAWAADVVTVARSWAGGPVHLIGHSLGGYIARAAVVAEPSAFASLVLLDSGRGPTIEAADRDRREFLQRLRTGGPAAAWTDDPNAEPDRAALLRERIWTTRPAALYVAGAVLSDPPPMVEALAATGVPTLVVYGSEEDLWPLANLIALARELGRDPVVIHGSGHLPNEDNPDATAAAMLAFWREADDGAPA
ncbi:MAG: hypothetical protein QOF57_1501 [Frankiaceae bacterium]|nr:hypothetical protein [Frankiaceae bacterium]